MSETECHGAYILLVWIENAARSLVQRRRVKRFPKRSTSAILKLFDFLNQYFSCLTSGNIMELTVDGELCEASNQVEVTMVINY